MFYFYFMLLVKVKFIWINELSFRNFEIIKFESKYLFGL